MLNELCIHAKLGFSPVLKRSLSARWMQVKLSIKFIYFNQIYFVAFNLNCGLHAVSVGVKILDGSDSV